MMIAALALVLVPEEAGVFEGPGRACLKHSYVDLLQGETLKIDGAGTESAHFTLSSTQRRLQLIESEIIGDEGDRGTDVRNDGTTRVFRAAGGRDTRYRFYGRTDYSPDRDKLVLVLTGLPARHTASGTSLLRRIHVAEAAPDSCTHAYRYGWDVISETLDQ
jgi:hypothetical protein